MGEGSLPPVGADACAVLGRIAALLQQGRPLPEALHLLASGLGVRTVVLRGADGQLLGTGGEALAALSVVPAQEAALEFPVPGARGEHSATLTVRGARPSQLPALRAAASILALAPSARSVTDQPALVDDAEQVLDELADELHDGPMQTLMVARYAADAAVRGGDPAVVREAVQRAVVELRTLVWSLRPRGESGLVPALEQLAAARDKQGLPPLALEAPAASVDVDPAVARLAYRLVQASAAQQVRIVLQTGAVSVEINGGLPSAARWARRAEVLGCRLTASADHCQLLLPVASGSYSTDVRTTS